ncbi:MAG: efflux RND transporter periplasmic adaptor subunit [bacterium]
MKKMSAAAVYAVCAASLAVLLASCKPNEGQTKVQSLLDQKRVAVVVRSVQREDVAWKIVTNGTFQADEKAMISPRAPGKIMEIAVDEGDRVEKGQVLVRMDDTQLHLDVKRAEATCEELRARLEAANTEVENAGARLAAAQAAVARSQADLKLKALEEERIERLVKNQSLPRQKYDYAKSAFDIAQASLQASQAELESAQAGLKAAQAGLKTTQASLASGEKLLAIARERLSDTRVPAPFSGVISKKIMNMGEMGDTGKTILVLEKIDLLEFRAKVSSEYLQQVKPGLTVTISPDGFTAPIQASIDRVNPAVDPVDRSVEVVCNVPNPTGALKPGLFAKLEITAQVFQQAVVVPSFAIVERNHQRVVFVADQERAKMVPVEVADYEVDEKNIILKGLAGNELLIIEGQNELAGDEPLLVKKGS